MTLAAYPLPPIINLVASILNVLTLTTRVRQSWSAGLPLLSVWLLLITLLGGIEAIVWHGVSAIKAPIWCDICAVTEV